MKLPLFIAVCCVLLWGGYEKGFRLNVTPSLERGIYRLSDERPRRGDIVTFCLSGPTAELARERGYLQAGGCPSGLRPLMKFLAGVPGDTVTVSEDGIACGPTDGPRCAWPVRALPEDRNGRPLRPAGIAGTIPRDMALLLTTHPGGFDGRYFGLVPFDSLQKMKPVFTF